MIVMLAGLPGTGKSTLARALAAQLPADSVAVLDKDTIRATLFSQPALIEYSAEQDDFCMELMLQTAAYLLARGPRRTIFLDGRTFSRQYQRQRVIDRCAESGWPWAVIECTAADEVAICRLEAAFRDKSHPAANRNQDLYRDVKANWESIPQPKLVLDTGSGDLDSCVDRALAYLSGPQRPVAAR